MQPLADLSYMDLLPQHGENNNNFVTFVDEEHVMINYGGQYLIFNQRGFFVQRLEFGKEQPFRPEIATLVSVSDSGKYFLFQGPHFLTEEERKEKKKQQEENKKAQAEKTAAPKGDADKQKHAGQREQFFYVFKLESSSVKG